MTNAGFGYFVAELPGARQHFHIYEEAGGFRQDRRQRLTAEDFQSAIAVADAGTEKVRVNRL